MLITPRRRPALEQAQQVLTQAPGLIHAADRARRQAASGGLRVGPRPVEDLPPAPAVNAPVQLAPRPPVAATPVETPALAAPQMVAAGAPAAGAPVVNTSYEPPPPGSVEEAEEQLNATSGRKVEDHNGRLMSILKMALIGGGQNFQGGHTARNWQELAGGVGAGIAGGIAGGVSPKLDEQIGKDIDITRGQGELDRRTKNETNRANIRYKNATSEKVENYDEIERDRLRVKTLIAQEVAKDRRAGLTERERHNQAAERLHAQGLLGTEEYRAARLEDFDADRVQRGQFEAGRNEDRDLSREATNARFERTFGLANERFGSAEAQRIFTTKTKGAFESLRSIQKKIEGYHTASAKAEMRPETAQARIVELEIEAARLTDTIEGARADALNAPTSRPAVPRAPHSSSRRPAAAPAPSSAVPTLNEDAIRAHARERGLDPDELVRRARARGALR